MNIWEQQSDETAAQYKAFRAYLDKRSIDAAYREYAKDGKPQKAAKSPKKKSSGKASGSFKMWAKAFRWEERSKAYDAHISNETIRNTVDVNKEAYKKRVKIYENIASRAINKTADLIDSATKLSEILPVVEYFDRMQLAAMEREQLTELQSMVTQQ
jgi:hypothetical protein